MSDTRVLDGMIKPGSSAFPFPIEDWSADSYLWADRGRIMVSFVFAKNPASGALSRLFKAIEDAGYDIAVPTPLGNMTQILLRKGFEPHMETSEIPEMGGVVVWMRPGAAERFFEAEGGA